MGHADAEVATQLVARIVATMANMLSVRMAFLLFMANRNGTSPPTVSVASERDARM
jgi:hypothetical protein